MREKPEMHRMSGTAGKTGMPRKRKMIRIAVLRIYFFLLRFYYIFEYINECAMVVQAFIRCLQRYVRFTDSK